MTIRCEHCDGECDDLSELEVEHRACRLKAAFPGAYSEKNDGLVSFDVSKIGVVLGYLNDLIIDTHGDKGDPMGEGLHFRVGVGWTEPEVWIELPIQVGNHLSSWSFRISAAAWKKVAHKIAEGLQAASEHLAKTK